MGEARGPYKPRMKRRRPYQRTSASAISTYLRARDLAPQSVRSETLQTRWVIVVNCTSMSQANAVWTELRNGGYNLLGQWHEWIIVGEKQSDEVGVL